MGSRDGLREKVLEDTQILKRTAATVGHRHLLADVGQIPAQCDFFATSTHRGYGCPRAFSSLMWTILDDAELQCIDVDEQ